MKLKVSLDVKFRFMFVDLYKYHQDFIIPVPMEAIPFAGKVVSILQFDKRGVKIVTTILMPEEVTE